MPRPGKWSVCWCGRETEMCREMLQLTHCWHHDDDGKKGTFQVIDDVGFLSTTSRWLLSLFIVTSLTSCYTALQPACQPSSEPIWQQPLSFYGRFLPWVYGPMGRLKRNIEKSRFQFYVCCKYFSTHLKG